MSSIRLQAASGSWASDVPRSFVVGREAGCDITSTDPAVSRRHAEIRSVAGGGDGWEVVDLGSSHGTWVNGQRVQQHALSGTTTVRFGEAGSGFDVTVTVTGAAAGAPDRPPAAPPVGGAPPLPPPGLDVTMVPRSGPGPGGPGGFGGGPGLLVRADDRPLRFAGGQQVRIGREPGLEVVTDDPTVSRQHALVESRPDGWWFVDRSTAGSFRDGERVTTLKLTEPVTLLLGHPTAGFELELVPVVDAAVAAKGLVKKKRRRGLALVAAAVALLVVVGGGVAAAVLLGGDEGGGSGRSPQSAEGGEGLSVAELDRAKAATVYLQIYGPGDEPLGSGSGAVISDDGLIITNAHVADSDAPGQDSDPVDHVLVGFTNPENDDDPVELRYRAEAIVSDGLVDVAVVQIVADVEGNEVDTDDLDLPEPLPIGDSDSLRTNDEVTALGFPGLVRANSQLANDDLPQLTVTTGRIATFTGSDILESERGEIDADLRIGSGNSGGPSIDENGEIVALNTRGFTERLSDATGGEGGQFTGGSARLVPINLTEAVREIAADGGDPSYVSPYLANLPDADQQMSSGSATVEQHGWAPEGEQGTCAGTSTVEQPQIVSVAPGDVVFAEFVFTGLEEGTPFTIELLDIQDPSTTLGSAPVTWEAQYDGQCVFVGFEVPAGVAGINAVPVIGGQPVVDNPLQFQ